MGDQELLITVMVTLLTSKGLNVLVLKYNLDMSLSEEMRCWMSDLKYYDNMFKKMKNAWKLR